MDNTKIFIDIDDEITFIAERVLSVKTQNVILVVPEKAGLLSSLASLKLLHNVVEKSGKKIVIVTMDETGKILSEKAGFKTRNRVGEVEPSIWGEFLDQVLAETGQTPEQAQPELADDTIVEENTTQSIEEDTDKASIVANLMNSQPMMGESSLPEEEVPNETEPATILNSEEAIEVDTLGEEEELIKIESQSLEEVPIDKPEEDELKEEISIGEVKSMNPKIFEIDNILNHSPESPKEDLVPEPKVEPVKPKYVESVRIVKLDGFELVVGGDAAAIKKSREIERRVIANKVNTISSLHNESQLDNKPGITGEDIEANIVKKKRTNKLISSAMQILNTVNGSTSKYFKKWMLIPAGILLAIILIISFIFVPSSTVLLKVDSRPLIQTNEVIANVNNQGIDATNNQIAASPISVNESSSSSASTTGQKVVGTNAKGPVTIYNQTHNQLNIPAGTVFITSDAHQFTLDSDVNIAAPQGQPTSATGSLTAKDIGSSYNIAASTTFTIADQTLNGETLSNANGAFTGGTSQNAQVVAQSDQDTLLKNLENQLYQKGKDELATKLTSDMNEINDSLKNEDVTKSFDSNVGDKAAIVNLSLTTKTSVLAYKTSDLNAYAKQVLTKNLKQNETLKNIQVDDKYESYDANSGNVKLKITVTAAATPVLNTTDMITAIKGKTVGSAQNYLGSLNGVKDVQINTQPFWFSLFRVLPFRAGNIKFNIITS